MDTVIELKNIIKEYDNVRVVDNLNLKIFKGEIFGFLGPNGAGKSTSINMIVGLVKPNSGEVLINGKPQLSISKEVIGVCPQDIVLWDHLTCYENLYTMGKMYEIPKEVLKERITSILDKLILTEKKDTLITELSGGMKRRMNIAMATIHNPSIIVLDEPSEGLDPQSRRVLWDYIKYQKSEGKTIILTTHLMDEADNICDRVGIIDKGKLLKLDTPFNLKQSIGEGDILDLTLENNEDINKVLELLKTVSGVKSIRRVDDKLSLNLLAAVTKLPEIIHLIEDNDSKLKDISIRQNTLEDVFIELTGRNLRD